MADGRNADYQMKNDRKASRREFVELDIIQPRRTEEPCGEEYEPQHCGEEYEPQPYGEEYESQPYEEEYEGPEYLDDGECGPEEYYDEGDYGPQEYEEEYGPEEYPDEEEYGQAVKRRPRKKRKKNVYDSGMGSLLRAVVFLFLFLCMGYLLLPSLCVKTELTVEAGDNCPGVGSFLNWNSKSAVYVSEVNENTVMSHVGDYGVIIRIYGRNVAAVLHVRDTVAPEIIARNVTLSEGAAVTVEDFLEAVNDSTQTSVRFVEEPDFSRTGVTEVVLEAEDEGGNISRATALLEVKVSDTEPPVISGVKELTMTAGSSISYKKGITVTDNYDEDVELTVDTSAVNTEKPGDYKVIYRAVDRAGNVATASTVLHVKPVTAETITEEQINAEADKLLASLFGSEAEQMSLYDKAKLIYNWCHDKIAYSDGTPKADWIQGAYQGLVNRKGDCYTYAATAKCLLTQAGITNMDIERIRVGDSMHFWNLIDIGEGWHHFDTCRRKDGSTFFYKTDEELMEYSDAHNGTHNYDRSKYPEIE